MYYLKGTIINIITALQTLLSKDTTSFGENTSVESTHYPYDPGISITEYYTDRFLDECKFSPDSETLYIDSTKKLDLSGEKTNTYKAVILKDVLNQTLDYMKLLTECHRILKKNGALIVTASSLAVGHDKIQKKWGFTENGLKYIVSKLFDKKSIIVRGYGNVLVGRYVLAGKSTNNLNEKELLHYDPFFTIIVGICATK